MELVLILVTVLLILACGIFVAAEFALLAVNRQTVERLADKGDGPARGVLSALRTLSTQLSSAQVGITITNLAIGFLAEPVIARLISPVILAIGLPEASVSGIAIACGLIIATALTMVFGELVPKNLAIARPLGTARFIQRPLLFFTAVMRWPIRVLNGSANWILHRFGVEAREELASARSADELLSLVRRSAAKGTLAQDTATMLERSLGFTDLTALDVMTPRVRAKAVQADTSINDALALAASSGFSRYPVYGKNLDDIIGVVHVKHAFALPREERRTATVARIMRPAVLVPSSIELMKLLETLRGKGLQLAVVIDEFGGMDGIVTMEDVLEELVGDVRDEHDRSRSARIRPRGANAWVVSGLLRPDEIADELGIFLAEENDVETLGGLFMHQSRAVPNRGDHVTLPAVDREGTSLTITLKVERMDSNRIDRLLLTSKSVEGEQA